MLEYLNPQTKLVPQTLLLLILFPWSFPEWIFCFQVSSFLPVIISAILLPSYWTLTSQQEIFNTRTPQSLARFSLLPGALSGIIQQIHMRCVKMSFVAVALQKIDFWLRSCYEISSLWPYESSCNNCAFLHVRHAALTRYMLLKHLMLDLGIPKHENSFSFPTANTFCCMSRREQKNSSSR